MLGTTKQPQEVRIIVSISSFRSRTRSEGSGSRSGRRSARSWGARHACAPPRQLQPVVRQRLGRGDGVSTQDTGISPSNQCVDKHGCDQSPKTGTTLWTLPLVCETTRSFECQGSVGCGCLWFSTWTWCLQNFCLKESTLIYVASITPTFCCV